MKNNNGISNFSKMMFKADIKGTKFYIALTAITMALIFNMINISFNDIYASKDLFYEQISSMGVSQGTSYELVNYSVKIPLEVMQKQNLLIVVCITILFAAICNMNYIKRKSKELGFILINGCSLLDITKYLLNSTGRCYIIAAMIGIPLGILLIPVFNLMMYFLMGKSGDLFTFNLGGFATSVIYIFMQYLTLVMLNIAFVVRKEVLTLMKAEKRVTFIDERQFKIPNFIFIIAYLTPIVFIFKGASIKGAENMAFILSFVGMIGIYGLAKYAIPKFIDKLKRRDYMFKGLRSIYYSNFTHSLSSSIIYMIALTFIYSYFTFNIIEFKDYEGMKAMGIFSIAVCSIIISFSLVYKLLVDTNDKIYLYNQLKILGYDEEHILKIVKKEAILTFVGVLMLPLTLLLGTILNYIFIGIYSFGLGIGVITIIISSLFIAWFVSNKVNQNKVKESLFNNVK